MYEFNGTRYIDIYMAVRHMTSYNPSAIEIRLTKMSKYIV